MRNQQNKEPITSAEYFSLMRLLQHLENEGEIPGASETDWQTIYEKLNYQCCETRKNPELAKPAWVSGCELCEKPEAEHFRDHKDGPLKFCNDIRVPGGTFKPSHVRNS
jgi:hypothetical protein